MKEGFKGTSTDITLTQFLRRIKEDMFKFHFTLLVPQFCPQTLSLRLIYLQIAILFANRNKSRVQTAADNLTDRMARLVKKELTFYENSDCITKLFGKNEITHTQKGKEMAFDFTEDKDRRVESCRLKIIEVVMSVLVQ